MKKKSIKKTSKSPVDLAAEVSQRVNIKDICLTKANCQKRELADSRELPVKLDHSCETRLDKKRNLIKVLVTFSLNIGKDEKESFVSIEAEFELVYGIKDFTGLKRENFIRFGQFNGVYNAWPYWREFVHNTFARMNLPPLILPSYHIPK